MREYLTPKALAAFISLAFVVRLLRTNFLFISSPGANWNCGLKTPEQRWVPN